LFYWLVALPTLVYLAFSFRKMVAALIESRIFLAYLLFACYMVTTLLWSNNEDNVLTLAKRPFFIVLVFLFIFEFGRRRPDLLKMTIECSALFAVFAGLYTLYLFIAAGAHGRLEGYGVLSNPLLVSHVFGFFLALWLGHYFCKRKLVEPLHFFAFVVLAGLLLATGSRTPLAAMIMTVIWLAVLTLSRKGAVALGALAILGGAIFCFFPEVILQRGLSYRPEIWADVAYKISANPWFGHGFGTSLQVWVEDLNQTFSESHNIMLSVLYSGGMVGSALWAAIYLVALGEAWRWRRDRWVLMFSATVVYGFVAGLTGEGAFFSRPKEVWFLVWIPITLLSHATFKARTGEHAE
jgi:O-antigen ligase